MDDGSARCTPRTITTIVISLAKARVTSWRMQSFYRTLPRTDLSVLTGLTSLSWQGWPLHSDRTDPSILTGLLSLSWQTDLSILTGPTDLSILTGLTSLAWQGRHFSSHDCSDPTVTSGFFFHSENCYKFRSKIVSMHRKIRCRLWSVITYSVCLKGSNIKTVIWDRYRYRIVTGIGSAACSCPVLCLSLIMVCLTTLQSIYKIMNHHQTCSLSILGLCPDDPWSCECLVLIQWSAKVHSMLVQFYY